MSRAVLLVAILLALAIAFGGGGTPNPLSEIFLQLLAAGLAMVWIACGLRGPKDRRISILVAMAVALPAVQLLPLPPAIWQALPGRVLEMDALRLVDAAQEWQPFSIAPALTLASLLSLGPPLLAMVLVAALPWQDRAIAVRVTLAMALAAALLGAAQLAGGPESLRPYPVSHSGWLTGFHANRNAAADLLLIGLAALFALVELRPHKQQAWTAASAALPIVLGIILVAAIILTGSRAGIALLILLLAIQLIRSIPILVARCGARATALLLGGVAILLLSAGMLLRTNAVLSAIATRFALGEDARVEIWRDAAFAARSYWPLGSGVGTFVPAFLPAERLGAVDASFPNRAHNDYLEWMIEGGLPGILLALAGTGIIAAMVREGWKDDLRRPQMRFALSILLVIALHSCVDYPLRSMAIACLAGAAIGLLARSPDRHDARGE